MRFLIAFVAVLGYASASVYAPLAPLVVGHANAGDVQAAHIDAAVAAQDYARSFGENQARAAEAATQYNIEATRQIAETNRDLHENAYWNGVAASQNYVAAAQSQAAAASGVVAARAGHLGAPAFGYAGYGAPLGLATPYLAPGVYGGYGHW